MASVITAARLQQLRTTLRNDFQRAYQVAPTWWQNVADMFPSGGPSNTYPFTGQLDIMQPFEGERKPRNIKEYFYQLLNQKWELTYAIKRNDLEDDTLGLYAQKFQELGVQAKKHPDYLMRDTIQNGQNNPCYDGLSFFNTAHPVDPNTPAFGTYSNYSAAGMALTLANYESVRSTMMSYRGTNGEVLNIVPNILLVPPQLEIQARRIVQGDMVPTSSGVAPGQAPETNMLKGTAEIVVAKELANQPNRWYLLATNNGVKPFIYQVRVAPEIQMLVNLNDPNVFNLDEFRYGVYSRDAAGYALPFLAYSASA